MDFDPSILTDEERQALWWAVHEFPLLDTEPPVPSDDEIRTWEFDPSEIPFMLADFREERRFTS